MKLTTLMGTWIPYVVVTFSIGEVKHISLLGKAKNNMD